MSTVLWANQLLKNGEVVSDESDKWALYKHTRKLDKLASAAKVEPFSSLIDYTDIQFNVGDSDLPDGRTSTNALMAHEGVWKSADDTLAILNALLAEIRCRRPGFGVIRNDYDAVTAELAESIEFAKKASEVGARFNLSVVM